MKHVTEETRTYDMSGITQTTYYCQGDDERYIGCCYYNNDGKNSVAMIDTPKNLVSSLRKPQTKEFSTFKAAKAWCRDGIKCYDETGRITWD